MVPSTENSPLLSKRSRKPTPLPWIQLSIVLLAQACEPLVSQSIYPYINQLVGELDIVKGDERKVGYYAGLIESLFYVTEAFTVLQWSRLSDQVGRKPIMLLGLFGSSVSILSFGLSRTFLGLVISRCLCGLLNGNIGVIKSAMSELTDSTNRAEGFALLPVVWAAGSTLGPLIGGTLSKPTERFPEVFWSTFWKEYPYFLPCLAASSLVLLTSFVLTFFKETVPQKTRFTPSEDNLGFRSQDEPVPLRQLLVFPVIISVANYMSIAFLNICLNALIPLFFAMPLEIGGLGFGPATIGYIIGSYGAFTGVFQTLFFVRIIRHLGPKRTFIVGTLSFLPIFLLFPVMSYFAQSNGGTAIVWTCVYALIPLWMSSDMAFGSIFIYVTASAPNKRSLGATHGLSQTTVSMSRALAPAVASSLFSVSVERNLLGGHAVFTIMFVLSCLAVFLGLRLPSEVWPEAGDDDSLADNDDDCRL